ncbi:E3 ubiquitin-protein ligase JMJ24 [Linum grandiflorum]
MENPRSSSGNGEDNVDMPDDLRCKRSDGKQWRCTAMSMPDKTVCEKHYHQAKRRAANSALRASLKKAKKKSAAGESDGYLESKSGDEFDMPLASMKAEESKKHREKFQTNDEFERDAEDEDNWRSYNNTPPSQRSFDGVPVTEYSVGTTESSEDIGGLSCHQCQRKDRSRVLWCLKCDKRGFCDNCISAWYTDIPWEEIEKVCPACRGLCNCKACLRGDNMVKVRIREIPILDKLQYLYCLLSSVLPVVKQIHDVQCSEVELEKRLRGTDNIDLARVKLNADEQMCCNICRIPIIDYHRHCPSCSFDLCLHCCQDLREASECSFKGEVKESRLRLDISADYPHWKANSDGSIPCPPRDYGGCNYSSTGLSRIFKMNWVAKLVKNVEEMVSGCKLNDGSSPEELFPDDPSLSQCAYREDSKDNLLYFPSSEELKGQGVNVFRKHWARGEPILVKQVFDSASMPSWDPMVIWRGIVETSDGKMKDESRVVKAIDCLSCSEVDVELGQFIKGYKEGRRREDGSLEMLKLKDWPSPTASEEFLLYQRPEFLSKLPLLEYIHSRLGLLNVAAKLPHYSLQNDVGPKIYLSYGTAEELGRGDPVANLHFKMRDMVYLLVHTHEVKPQGWVENESSGSETSTNERLLPDLSHDVTDMLNVGDTIADDNGIAGDQEVGTCADVDGDGDEMMKAPVVEGDKVERRKHRQSNKHLAHPGVQWDVFRRQDVPQVVAYLRNHIEELRNSCDADLATHLLYDGTIFLNGHHKQKLKEELGVEPWSFDQHLGEAIFVPAGCPFQVRNLQVGKISLYAASSSIKEVQKLVLDPKFSTEIGFEDPNLTSTISDNLEKLTGPRPQRQISCA